MRHRLPDLSVGLAASFAVDADRSMCRLLSPHPPERTCRGERKRDGGTRRKLQWPVNVSSIPAGQGWLSYVANVEGRPVRPYFRGQKHCVPTPEVNESQCSSQRVREPMQLDWL